MKIQSARMTEKNFADYGYFISALHKKNDERNNYKYTGNLVHMDMNEVTVGYLTAYARAPLYDSLEKHNDTEEMLVVLSGGGVILFAKPGDNPNEGLAALEVKQGDTLVMKPSTWHGLITPKKCESVDLLVVFKKCTEDSDLHFHDLTDFVEVLL